MNAKKRMTTLTKEQQEKLATTLNEAGKVGGKGLQDVVKAQAMGIAVQTDAGKTISSMASQTSKMYRDRTDQAMNQSIKVDEFRRQSAEAMAKATHMAAKEQRITGRTLAIIGMQGGALAEHMSVLARNTVEINKQGGETLEQTRRRYEQEADKQKTDQEQVSKDRKSAQDMEDAMRRFNLEMNKIMPILVDNILIPAMNWFSNNAETVAGTIVNFVKETTTFIKNLFSPEGREQILKNISQFLVDLGKEIRNMLFSNTNAVNKAGQYAIGGAAGGAVVGAGLGAFGGPLGMVLGGVSGGLIGGIGSSVVGYLKGLFEGRASGTYGATGKIFEDFGKGTPIIAHGVEGVFTPDQIGHLLSGAAGSGTKDAVDSLNITQQQILLTMKQLVEYTKRNVDATRSLKI